MDTGLKLYYYFVVHAFDLSSTLDIVTMECYDIISLKPLVNIPFKVWFHVSVL